MTSAKFSDFFTPLSLSQISRLCSFRLLLRDPPPPTHFGRHIWKPPYVAGGSGGVMGKQETIVGERAIGFRKG